jgi:hypothetical protein
MKECDKGISHISIKQSSSLTAWPSRQRSHTPSEQWEPLTPQHIITNHNTRTPSNTTVRTSCLATTISLKNNVSLSKSSQTVDFFYRSWSEAIILKLTSRESSVKSANEIWTRCLMNKSVQHYYCTMLCTRYSMCWGHYNTSNLERVWWIIHICY